MIVQIAGTAALARSRYISVTVCCDPISVEARKLFIFISFSDDSDRCDRLSFVVVGE